MFTLYAAIKSGNKNMIPVGVALTLVEISCLYLVFMK